METKELERFVTAIELLAAAIRYHADVIGYQADEQNPKDQFGHSAVKLTTEADAPAENEPVETELPTYSLQEVKAALNAYLKKESKEAAIALVKKYTGGSTKAEDIKPEDYRLVIEEAA